jgi:hypothetical protein
MKKITLVFVAVFGFCFHQGNGQTYTKNESQLGFELNMVLSEQFKPSDPGCAVLVVRKGQIIYEKAVGLADAKLNTPLTKGMAFGEDSIALNSYRLIKKESLELAGTGYKLNDEKDNKNADRIEINYGSRSTIPILTLRKTSDSNGFNTNIIYVPDEDIFISLFINSENKISNDVTQTVFNKVLTDTFSSLGFKDNDNSRFVFYHFLLTVKVLPNGGIIEKGQTYHVYINGNTRNLRYTTDGSEPTIASRQYIRDIELPKACILKVKVIPSAKSDTLKSASYVFKEGVAPEPLRNINGLKPGLRYSYYEGTWNSLPDFSKLTPKLTGITEVPDIGMALKTDNFAVQFDGFVYINKEGMYNIYSISDDGSKVFLNDELIINSDGAHGSVPEAYIMPLKKGYYPVKVLYFENSGGQVLNIGYWTDGNEPKAFTKDMLFYRE